MEEKVGGALLEKFKVCWQRLEFIPFFSTISHF